MALVVTYNHDELRKRTFDLLADGKKLASQVVDARGPQRFFEVVYPLPPELVLAKQKVTVRFQATEGNGIAAVFGLRMIRSDSSPGPSADD